MRSLRTKLTLAFLLVSLAGVGLVALSIWWVTSHEFDRFILDRGQNNFLSAAATYYENNGSWQGILRVFRQQGLLPPPPQGGDLIRAPFPPFVLLDIGGFVVIPSGPYFFGQHLPGNQLSQGQPVVVSGQTVGYVLTTGERPQRDSFENRYLVRIYQGLLIAALGAVMFALGLGIFLARTITRPVRELITATHAVAKGDLKQQVPVRSKDELGELAATFNKMSADIENANYLRHQMTADIAHDLRSPLSVISGYLESLRDGVLQPTPERFDVLFREAKHLQRLVDDLRELSLVDSGELAINQMPVPPGSLLEHLAAIYQHQADQRQIHLKVNIEPNLPEIFVDTERMEQVLGNIISNALRYTLDGGEIVLSTRRQGISVLLAVQDDGAGISSDILPHIFDRFYRGESARQGSESGLGLAIAKEIVKLHGGSLTATSDGLGKGSCFTICIPLRKEKG